MEYPENPTDCHDVVGNRYEYGQTCKSWPGISCAVRAIEREMKFHVQGFRHTGMVQVILDEGKDLFEIHLIPDSEGERKIIEDVYFDMLVSVIDENVEKTDDYEKRISEEHGIIRE